MARIALSNRFVAYEHLAKLAIPVRQATETPAEPATDEKAN
jgi:hypothetical protein